MMLVHCGKPYLHTRSHLACTLPQGHPLHKMGEASAHETGGHWTPILALKDKKHHQQNTSPFIVITKPELTLLLVRETGNPCPAQHSCFCWNSITTTFRTYCPIKHSCAELHCRTLSLFSWAAHFFSLGKKCSSGTHSPPSLRDNSTYNYWASKASFLANSCLKHQKVLRWPPTIPMHALFNVKQYFQHSAKEGTKLHMQWSVIKMFWTGCVSITSCTVTLPFWKLESLRSDAKHLCKEENLWATGMSTFYASSARWIVFAVKGATLAASHAVEDKRKA